ncbi:MAG: dihydrolipoyl dehydrogenase [Desulfobacteraceae bacterium]|nr:MAG: dihydrolipoyl dehydrogenase [Desulfobacteraceae bacterium]
MAQKLVVIGAGPGGYVAAVRAAQLGAEVTLIEKENVGGTCLNWGCIPSKVLKTTAELLERSRRAAEFGLVFSGPIQVDMKALMERKQKVIQDQAKGIERLLEHHKITYIQGNACFEKLHSVRVMLPGVADKEIPWDKLVLAPGSKPFNMPGFAFNGRTILSNNHALCLEQVPQSILIVGGGVIGCEFASILGAYGSKVTVVEALTRLLPLPGVDEACSKVLQREMKKQKIDYFTERSVLAVEEKEGRCRVTIGASPFMDETRAKTIKPQVLEVDKVLISIGRESNTTDMGLERIGVKLDGKGWIAADESLATNVGDVYAIGDALGPAKVMLAHVASREGMIAVENALGGKRKMDYSVIPSAIFTIPETANVGLSEAQAREKGFQVKTESVLFRTIGKAQVVGEISGEAKIVADAETGRILGVHIIGPHATDLIAEGALAIQTGCTLKDLAGTIHAHPTLAEIMFEVSLKALGQALHG